MIETEIKNISLVFETEPTVFSPNAVDIGTLLMLSLIPDIDARISDGLDNIIENDFTLILSNPPYHTDFSVAKHFIEIGFKKLQIGGRMVMVTKRLKWYKNKLPSVFGDVKVQELHGYYVFVAEKRCAYIKKKEKGNKLSKKLKRKIRK